VFARQAALAAAVADGAEPAANPAHVTARTQIILTSLPDAGAVREVALGAAGVVTGDCSGRLLVDTSTTSPAEARDLANDLAPYGVAFLDAPVSGGVTGAESGQLAIMIGGSPEDVERARLVLACLGKAVVHCGSVGAGQVTKA